MLPDAKARPRHSHSISGSGCSVRPKLSRDSRMFSEESVGEPFNAPCGCLVGEQHLARASSGRRLRGSSLCFVLSLRKSLKTPLCFRSWLRSNGLVAEHKRSVVDNSYCPSPPSGPASPLYPNPIIILTRHCYLSLRKTTSCGRAISS